MNYKAIVFDGFINPISWKNLNAYFKRQYENAKKEENYSVDEFFSGCIEIVNDVDSIFWRLLMGKKTELLKEGLKDEFHLAKKEDLTLDFAAEPYFDNKYKGNFYYNQLKYIETTIEDVKLSLQPKNDDVPSKIEPLDFNLNQTDVVHFFALLVEAGVIKEPRDETHKTRGGFYGKIAQYFTAKGKKINYKSAKTTITNKKNKALFSYSESYYKLLKDLQGTIDKELNSKS